jgi:hypothetical protein
MIHSLSSLSPNKSKSSLWSGEFIVTLYFTNFVSMEEFIISIRRKHLKYVYYAVKSNAKLVIRMLD